MISLNIPFPRRQSSKQTSVARRSAERAREKGGTLGKKKEQERERLEKENEKQKVKAKKKKEKGEMDKKREEKERIRERGL